jgi:hypothetical protein
MSLDVPVTKIFFAPITEPGINFTPFSIQSMDPIVVTLFCGSDKVCIPVTPGWILNINSNNKTTQIAVQAGQPIRAFPTHFHCFLMFLHAKDEHSWAIISKTFIHVPLLPVLPPSETVRVEHSTGALNGVIYRIIVTLRIKTGEEDHIIYVMIPEDASDDRFHYYIPCATHLQPHRFVLLNNELNQIPKK